MESIIYFFGVVGMKRCGSLTDRFHYDFKVMKKNFSSLIAAVDIKAAVNEEAMLGMRLRRYSFLLQVWEGIDLHHLDSYCIQSLQAYLHFRYL